MSSMEVYIRLMHEMERRSILSITPAKEWVSESDSDKSKGYYRYGFRVTFIPGEGSPLFYEIK